MYWISKHFFLLYKYVTANLARYCKVYFILIYLSQYQFLIIGKVGNYLMILLENIFVIHEVISNYHVIYILYLKQGQFIKMSITGVPHFFYKLQVRTIYIVWNKFIFSIMYFWKKNLISILNLIIYDVKIFLHLSLFSNMQFLKNNSSSFLSMHFELFSIITASSVDKQ